MLSDAVVMDCLEMEATLSFVHYVSFCRYHGLGTVVMSVELVAKTRVVNAKKNMLMREERR